MIMLCDTLFLANLALVDQRLTGYVTCVTRPTCGIAHVYLCVGDLCAGVTSCGRICETCESGGF